VDGRWQRGFADVPRIKYVGKLSYVAYCGQLSQVVVVQQMIQNVKRIFFRTISPLYGVMLKREVGNVIQHTC
jgi:hypothetical protein